MVESRKLLSAAISALVLALPAAAVQIAPREAMARSAQIGAQGTPSFAAAVSPDFRETEAPLLDAAPNAPILAAAPAASAQKDLTADFLAMHQAVRRGALKGAALPPAALQARFVLLKGLLGNHIQDYFGDTVRRMKDLGLDVTVLRTDTEGKTAGNLRALRSEIESSDKPMVLVGHSWGGDLIHDGYRGLPPELKAKIPRVVLLQAPLAGSPNADWTVRNKWQILKTLVGGWIRYRAWNLPRTVKGLSEGARSRVLTSLPAWDPGDLEKFYAVHTTIDAKPQHRYYETDRKVIERLGGGRNDGEVPEKSARLDGGYNIGLRNLDHRNLVVEHPDPKSVKEGYAPNPDFRVGDVAEALVRLIFR